MTILETWATERPEITIDERTKVGELCANFSAWLDGVEAEQAALPLTSPPAFMSAAVTAKLDPIETEVRRLIKKPKPKPKQKPKNATDTSNATSGNASGASSNSSMDSDEGAEDVPPHDEL